MEVLIVDDDAITHARLRPPDVIFLPAKAQTFERVQLDPPRIE